MATGREIIAITGVTAGLGLSMAEKFHSLGHVVVGCGRNKEKINEMNGRLPSPNGKPLFYVADVKSDQEISNWSKQVVDNFGAPTFLLNNAGIVTKPTNLWDVPVDEFDRLIDINVKGVANCIRHFVPAMISNKQGIIVNFSSGWGRTVDRHVAPYCCSKWGIEGLSKALAMELPSPLAAVALDPGMISTDMTQTVFGTGAAKMGQDQSTWVQKACPYILSITRSQNGKSLSIH